MCGLCDWTLQIEATATSVDSLLLVAGDAGNSTPIVFGLFRFAISQTHPFFALQKQEITISPVLAVTLLPSSCLGFIHLGFLCE